MGMGAGNVWLCHLLFQGRCGSYWPASQDDVPTTMGWKDGPILPAALHLWQWLHLGRYIHTWQDWSMALWQAVLLRETTSTKFGCSSRWHEEWTGKWIWSEHVIQFVIQKMLSARHWGCMLIAGDDCGAWPTWTSLLSLLSTLAILHFMGNLWAANLWVATADDMQVRHLIKALNEATNHIPGWDEYSASGRATQFWDGKLWQQCTQWEEKQNSKVLHAVPLILAQMKPRLFTFIEVTCLQISHIHIVLDAHENWAAEHPHAVLLHWHDLLVSSAKQMDSLVASRLSWAVPRVLAALIDQISDTHSQRCTDLQSVVTCLDYGHVVVVEYAVVQGCVTLQYIPNFPSWWDLLTGCIADWQVKAAISCIVHVHVEPRLEVVPVVLCDEPVCLVIEFGDTDTMCIIPNNVET